VVRIVRGAPTPTSAGAGW